MFKPILLVEDNPRDVELSLVALQKAQLANQIVVVRDGTEALDYLRCQGEFDAREPVDPAFVLLDLKMPRLDGLQVLTEIKGDPKLQVIPVVIMTSSREEADLIQSYRKGVNAYVVKPLNFRAFSNTLKDLTLFWATINEAPTIGPALDP